MTFHLSSGFFEEFSKKESAKIIYIPDNPFRGEEKFVAIKLIKEIVLEKDEDNVKAKESLKKLGTAYKLSLQCESEKMAISIMGSLAPDVWCLFRIEQEEAVGVFSLVCETSLYTMRQCRELFPFLEKTFPLNRDLTNEILYHLDTRCPERGDFTIEERKLLSEIHTREFTPERARELRVEAALLCTACTACTAPNPFVSNSSYKPWDYLYLLGLRCVGAGYKEEAFKCFCASIALPEPNPYIELSRVALAKLALFSISDENKNAREINSQIIDDISRLYEEKLSFMIRPVVFPVLARYAGLDLANVHADEPTFKIVLLDSQSKLKRDSSALRRKIQDLNTLDRAATPSADSSSVNPVCNCCGRIHATSSSSQYLDIIIGFGPPPIGEQPILPNFSAFPAAAFNRSQRENPPEEKQLQYVSPSESPLSVLKRMAEEHFKYKTEKGVLVKQLDDLLTKKAEEKLRLLRKELVNVQNSSTAKGQPILYAKDETYRKIQQEILQKLLPPEGKGMWQYDTRKDKYWLEVSDRERYKNLITQLYATSVEKSEELKKEVNVIKIQGKEAYCVIVRPDASIFTLKVQVADSASASFNSEVNHRSPTRKGAGV